MPAHRSVGVSRSQRHAAPVLVSIAVLFFAACGGSSSYELVGNSLAAGTDGTLEVEEIEGGNHVVTVSLEYLPPANRLGEGLEQYVFWLVPASGQPYRAAVLSYDEDERSGSAMATTTEPCFDAIVTAEPGGVTMSPSYAEVVRQRHCPEE